MKDEEQIDKLMKAALTSSVEPDELLNRKIEYQWKEQKPVKKIKRKKVPTVALVAVLVLAMAVTVSAAVKYMSSKEAAKSMGYDKIAEAFESPEAIDINETVTAGDYDISLLGITSGKELSNLELDASASSIIQGSTYAVVAIAKADGTAMPATSDDAYGEVPFFISPLIKGLTPWQYNIMSMNGGYSDMVMDGVMYRIIQCDNVEKFADKGIYLCVSNTSFYDNTAYNYDETTGEITANVDYKGINVLFNLPIDASKGDTDAAEAYLTELQNEWNQESVDEDTEETTDVTLDELLVGATLLEDSVQVVTVNPDDNLIHYIYNKSEIAIAESQLFEEGEIGQSDFFNQYSESDTTMEIVVFTKDEDGIIKGMTYTKPL